MALQDLELGVVEYGQPSNSHQEPHNSDSYTLTDPDSAESLLYRSGRRPPLTLSTDSAYSGSFVAASTNLPRNHATAENYHTHTMMQLLQVITFHRVAMLQVAKSEHQRSVIGAGVSCTVEEGRLPVSTLLESLRYHIPKLRPLFHRGNFIDHNGISWAPDKATAFKVITLMEDDEDQKSLRLEDLTTEICVLSHEPLKTHPNIVKLLGVAWTQAPTLNIIEARVEKPATPAALLELARHGSLLRFLHRPGNPLSLETKLKLCTDVLLAIQVICSDCVSIRITKY